MIVLDLKKISLIWKKCLDLFFREKIRSGSQSSSPIPVARSSPMKNTLSSFTLVTKDYVLKILVSSEIKPCDLGSIPTLLVKECADILKTPMTNITNKSLKEDSFANCFKTACVTPLSKISV